MKSVYEKLDGYRPFTIEESSNGLGDSVIIVKVQGYNQLIVFNKNDDNCVVKVLGKSAKGDKDIVGHEIFVGKYEKSSISKANAAGFVTYILTGNIGTEPPFKKHSIEIVFELTSRTLYISEQNLRPEDA